MANADLLKNIVVLLDSEADDADAIIDQLVDGLIQADSGLKSSRDDLATALREREQRGTTASQRVAFPHVQFPSAKKLSIAVTIHQSGIDFRALDAEPVNVFFSMIRPEGNDEEHLEILRWLASAARHTDFVSFALQAKTPKQFTDLLTELAPV